MDPFLMDTVARFRIPNCSTTELWTRTSAVRSEDREGAAVQERQPVPTLFPHAQLPVSKTGQVRCPTRLVTDSEATLVLYLLVSVTHSSSLYPG